MSATPPPPSKDASSVTLPEARSLMAQYITEISEGMAGDARQTLDHYLNTFTKVDDDAAFPLTLHAHEKNPDRCTASNKASNLFFVVERMIRRYWRFHREPTIHRQREWDSLLRQVKHIAHTGWGEFTVYGDDEHGYTLKTHEQKERLMEEPAEAARERRRRRNED
jgi:hypothetical protein